MADGKKSRFRASVVAAADDVTVSPARLLG